MFFIASFMYRILFVLDMYKPKNIKIALDGFKIEVDKIKDEPKEIRLKLPDELKQAKWVKEERGRILVEAQKEADGIVKEAENRIISMIDEHEITRKAYEQKKTLILGELLLVEECL